MHKLDQRFYTSQFGRFMSADRYRQAAKANDSGSWNKYSYTRGDPVNRFDRHGTCDGPPDSERSVTVCDDPPCTGDQQFDASCSAPTGGSGANLTGGSNGGSVQVQPKVPMGSNYTGSQLQTLASGFNDALAHTDNVDCALFYSGGDDDPVLATQTAHADTTYRILPLSSPGFGAQTVDYNTVFINSQGAFFTASPNPNGTVTVGLPNSNGVMTAVTFANLATLDGFLLLHELGHQLGLYGEDLTPAVNGANSKAVLDQCFTADAQGVYH